MHTTYLVKIDESCGTGVEIIIVVTGGVGVGCCAGVSKAEVVGSAGSSVSGVLLVGDVA